MNKMEDILYSKYYSIIFNNIQQYLESGEEIKHVEKGLKDKFKDVFN